MDTVMISVLAFVALFILPPFADHPGIDTGHEAVFANVDFAEYPLFSRQRQREISFVRHTVLDYLSHVDRAELWPEGTVARVRVLLCSPGLEPEAVGWGIYGASKTLARNEWREGLSPEVQAAVVREYLLLTLDVLASMDERLASPDLEPMQGFYGMGIPATLEEAQDEAERELVAHNIEARERSRRRTVIHDGRRHVVRAYEEEAAALIAGVALTPEDLDAIREAERRAGVAAPEDGADQPGSN